MDRKRLLIIAGAIAVILLVVALGLTLRQTTTFHLVNTDPDDRGTPHQYTAFTFTFNEDLAPSSPTVNNFDIRPGTAGSTEVKGKSIVFTPTNALDTGVTYTVNLQHVTSAKGETIADVSITFTPRYTSYDDLPADVKKRLNVDPEENNNAYFADAIAIAGTSTLTERGVTDDQMSLLKIAFFKRFQAQNQQVKALTVSNLTKDKHVYGSPSDTMHFDVTINDKLAYKAKFTYTSLTRIHLYLYDPQSGALLFDSGELDKTTTTNGGHD